MDIKRTRKRIRKSAEQKIVHITDPQILALRRPTPPFCIKSNFNASAKHKKFIEIKHRHLDRVIFATEAETLKDALEEAVELRVNLWGADLRNADLRGVNLGVAQLSNADFSGANLFEAILFRSGLIGTRFCNADLRYANFWYANLRKAVLKNSELFGADFFQANLTRINFQNSNLDGISLKGANITGVSFEPRPMAPEKGSFVGWKKVYDKQANPVITKLLIPEDAKRMTPLVGRHCRAEFVKVLELSPNVPYAKCRFYPDRIYRIGRIVRTSYYESDVQAGLGHGGRGINFFLTREEAEQCWGYLPSVPPVSTAEYWKSETYREWGWAAKHLREIELHPERYPEITQFTAKLRAMGLR